MSLIIRSENTQDIEAITNIHTLAFEQKDEGILVEQLRQNPEFVPELSLVADIDGNIIGHILFYPVIIDCDGNEFESLALAPMGVLPRFQNTGIGANW